MENDVKEFLSELLKQLKSIDYIKPEDIPNIDLYMDQVTTFMDEQLAASKRYESDKILTKTMINNYAKNNLLPSPDKKKYSKEHVLTLLFIYYFKNILSINDIRSILNPLIIQIKSPEIIRQPQNAEGKIGSTIVFSVEAANVKNYEWQYKEKGRNNWITFSWQDSYDTAEFKLPILNEGRLTNTYRCKITGEDGSIIYTQEVFIYSIKKDDFETPIL